jgi:hypothetical protein
MQFGKDKNDLALCQAHAVCSVGTAVNANGTSLPAI